MEPVSYNLTFILLRYCPFYVSAASALPHLLTEAVFIVQQPYEYDAKFKGTAWTDSYEQMGADNFSICSVGSSFSLPLA